MDKPQSFRGVNFVDGIDFGYTIRFLRKRLGITQTELGKRLGSWTEQKVSLYENNKRRVKASQVPAFAAAFEISISEFIEMANSFSNRHEYAFDLSNGKFKYNGSNVPEDKSDLLLQCFCKLNEAGQDEALRQIQMLSEIPRYQAKEGE